MMNWKNSLDKYLTTPPDDGYDAWMETALEYIPIDLYEENEQACDNLLMELFHKDMDAKEAALIVVTALNQSKT